MDAKNPASDTPCCLRCSGSTRRLLAEPNMWLCDRCERVEAARILAVRWPFEPTLR